MILRVQGCAYPLFVCHISAPKAIGLSLKNVYINSHQVCSGESADTKLKWSIYGQEGFCAKMPTQPKYAWLVLLTASKML